MSVCESEWVRECVCVWVREERERDYAGVR